MSLTGSFYSSSDEESVGSSEEELFVMEDVLPISTANVPKSEPRLFSNPEKSPTQKPKARGRSTSALECGDKAVSSKSSEYLTKFWNSRNNPDPETVFQGEHLSSYQGIGRSPKKGAE